MSDDFRKTLDRVGKGGVKCDCCNPYPRKDRAKLTRMTRARVKIITQQEIKQELRESYA